ncbi:MAG TPA: DUF3617 domain-containing protein [Thermoanaerobaculia bacterium]|nr:DUF3617 domain-containing protein [Thermoanaerobaculia bacterium]
MRKYVFYVLAATTVLATATTTSAADHPQKPGKWQVKVQMEIPGMPFQMPPVTTNVCLTAEDLADPQKAVPNDPKSKCTISDYKVEGNKVTWSMDCPKDKTKGTGEITFTDSSYTGTMDMTIGDQQMKSKYSGKWMGECSK